MPLRAPQTGKERIGERGARERARGFVAETGLSELARNRRGGRVWSSGSCVHNAARRPDGFTLDGAGRTGNRSQRVLSSGDGPVESRAPAMIREPAPGPSNARCQHTGRHFIGKLAVATRCRPTLKTRWAVGGAVQLSRVCDNLWPILPRGRGTLPGRPPDTQRPPKGAHETPV